MFKRLTIALVLLTLTVGVQASENLSDHEAFCMNTTQPCLTYIKSSLKEAEGNIAKWYKIKTYEFDYYFDYQEFDNLHEALSPFVDKDDLAGSFKVQVYYYYAKSLNYLKKEEEAKQYAAKAFAELDAVYNVFGDPIRLVELANLQFIFGDKKNAMRILSDAEIRYEKNQNPIFHFELQTNKGHIFLKWQQYDKAIQSNLKAYEAIKDTQYSAKVMVAAGNLAFCYYKNNELANAIKFYHVALNNTKADIYKQMYSIRLMQVYLEAGDEREASKWGSKIDVNSESFPQGYLSIYTRLMDQVKHTTTE